MATLGFKGLSQMTVDKQTHNSQR